MAETNAASAKRAKSSGASAGAVKPKKVKLETYVHVLNADSVAAVTTPTIGISTLLKMATPDGREAIIKAIGNKMTPFKYSVLEAFGDHVDRWQHIANDTTEVAEVTLREFSESHSDTWNGLLGVEQEYNEAIRTANSNTRNAKANMARYAAANAAAKSELCNFVRHLESEEDETVPIALVLCALEKVVSILSE
jgi:hypothetical protein